MWCDVMWCMAGRQEVEAATDVPHSCTVCFPHVFKGNKLTLETRPSSDGVDVRHELLKFHSTYYSSNLMGLCVLGRGKSSSLTSFFFVSSSGCSGCDAAISFSLHLLRFFLRLTFQTLWENSASCVVKEQHPLPVQPSESVCVLKHNYNFQ